MIKLYKKDNTGGIRYWDIDEVSDGLLIRHGQLNGKLQVKHEKILRGKVNRSQSEQIQLQINSRISRQLDKGYKHSIEEAKKGATNQLNLARPMLAQPIKNIKLIDWKNAFVQFKYDGERCLITNRDGKLIAYSRNGKIIDSIDHILKGLNIPEGYTLDGELYCHGEPLQKIASWIKRKQPDSTKLKYHIYDALIDIPYRERFEYLHTLDADNTIIAQTNIAHSLEEVMQVFPTAIAQGYEGLILRQGLNGYEANKRSRSLIKIKQMLDDEFEVMDIKPSKDGWAILICETFSVTAPGTMANKQMIMDHKEQFIGKYIRVEYANLTPDGIPFHPVAIDWRNRADE